MEEENSRVNEMNLTFQVMEELRKELIANHKTLKEGDLRAALTKIIEKVRYHTYLEFIVNQELGKQVVNPQTTPTPKQ